MRRKSVDFLERLRTLASPNRFLDQLGSITRCRERFVSVPLIRSLQAEQMMRGSLSFMNPTPLACMDQARNPFSNTSTRRHNETRKAILVLSILATCRNWQYPGFVRMTLSSIGVEGGGRIPAQLDRTRGNRKRQRHSQLRSQIRIVATIRT